MWCILTYLHAAAAASTCASMAEKASAVNAKSERLSKPPPPLLLAMLIDSRPKFVFSDSDSSVNLNKDTCFSFNFP